MSWKKVVGGIVGAGALVVVAALGYGATQPKTWRVERSVVVDAAPADVLPLLEDLEQWPKWAGGPDAAASGMTYTFGATKRGVGATYTWDAPSTHGTVTLTAVDAAGVAYAMTMEDSETPAKGRIALLPEGEGTRVTWTDEGDFSAMGPVGGLVVPMMEGSLGPHFEGALGTLSGLAKDAATARKAAEEKAMAEAAAAAEAQAAIPAEGAPLDGVAPAAP